MAEFNLIDEPWIPCIDLHDHSVEHGIRQTLLHAHELREICHDSPLVTTAIHRLLLAILYRAHGGIQDYRTWETLYRRETFDNKEVKSYLDAYSGRFNFISDEKPFFQMAGLETKQSSSVTRLLTECASGNNATLFDHSGDGKEVNWLPAEAARALVACQAFALGFGKSGNARINGKDETLPYSADGIALRGMNVWLQGKNLFETLGVNLTPTDDVSLPPWELEDPHEHRDRLFGKKRRAVASFGVVDRLTWQSRLVRLLPSGERVSRMYFTQGRAADKSPGDPMKVYRISKEEGVSPVPLSSGKAAWRDAHSIFMIPAPHSDERRPECLNLIARARSTGVIQPPSQFITHVVGLASAPNKAGKFLLWRHDRIPISVSLLANASLIERIGGLLQNAECAAAELNGRSHRIVKLYLAPDAEAPEGRQPDKDEVTRVCEAIDPRPMYWARLEKHFFRLIEDLPNDWDVRSNSWKPDDQQEATNTWRHHVKIEAKRAIGESICSLGTTARAIQAVARVRTDFSDDDITPMAQATDKAKQKVKGGKKE